MTKQRFFNGTLLEVPFGSETVQSIAVEQYRDILADHDREDVLVHTGSPTSMTTFREVLGDECPGAAVPYATSVIVHATDVINRTDGRAILSDAMRRELIHRFSPTGSGSTSTSGSCRVLRTLSKQINYQGYGCREETIDGRFSHQWLC